MRVSFFSWIKELIQFAAFAKHKAVEAIALNHQFGRRRANLSPLLHDLSALDFKREDIGTRLALELPGNHFGFVADFLLVVVGDAHFILAVFEMRGKHDFAAVFIEGIERHSVAVADCAPDAIRAEPIRFIFVAFYARLLIPRAIKFAVFEKLDIGKNIDGFVARKVLLLETCMKPYLLHAPVRK